ncbi:MAG TPA: hypothetical protein PK425_02275 [Syntrophales bacterium]|nr:hypothetical protein [Syntrophales bacterium]HPX55341.1 hypothetical protein [Syntrophales bacterium]
MTKRKKDPLSFLFFQTGYFQAWMISTLQRTRTHPLLLSEVQDFLLCLLLFHPLIMGEKQAITAFNFDYHQPVFIVNFFLDNSETFRYQKGIPRGKGGKKTAGSG